MSQRCRPSLRVLAACALLACGVATPLAAADGARGIGALAAYLSREDASFGWREVRAGKLGSSTYVELLMTSQTWRGVPWKHQLFVLRPAGAQADSRVALLFVHGGRWKEEYESAPGESSLPREAHLFARLANSIRAPVGVLRQVPHQPLFGLREDALIAHTFDRYLETGEEDWPLLLPMVKSAVRAMDVMQSLGAQRAAPIERFTVAGASKRGWTSWLVAAVDPRVMAVAPMVIDVLNMQAQMEHQRATWGELSQEIQDYSALDLPERLGTPRGHELLGIVDPYSYRRRLTRPKLVLLSTNDRYWPLDALHLYWSDLPAPKHVLYVPNQGHGLRDAGRVIGSLSALHRHAAAGETLPQLWWEFDTPAGAIEATVRTGRVPQSVRIWSARSATRDFREARWRSRRCTRAGAGHQCRVPRAPQGYTAAFAEVSFEEARAPAFSLSTTVLVAGAGEDR